MLPDINGMERAIEPFTGTVFISYSHHDREIALKLKSALEGYGINVRIDSETMQVGENIQGFIERSVRDTAVTILVVSNHSLLSPWVTMETLTTLSHEKFKQDKQFIACYVDDDFFQPRYRLDATKNIDARIKAIDDLIPEYIENKMDTNDLNQEKSRLFDLRNRLGEILLRLKESLTVDIRESNFDESLKQITSSIHLA